ncbi:zinc finger protein [Phyllosticta capitalensis]|uniref:Zinc finger protein n=1 Tax=Phyllosticta capitalensis TaxID=121624 RepID=A0ABR1YET8_9PEZI
MADSAVPKPGRSNSMSQVSVNSQTAQDFINSQLQLEADAREVLPYQFDTCSRPLGPLRQKLWSCLTCNPPAADPNEAYTPAGVCYSCHVSCHGDHTLVELFAKRNFVCDCGTTRIQSDHPCSLRINEETGLKGDVRGASPEPANHYDHNYRNRFCGCGQDYNAYEEKGTMFQCMGLGTVEDGGCGEDWWHPECIVGLPRDWYKKDGKASDNKDSAAPTAAKEEVTNINESTPAEAGESVPSNTNGHGAENNADAENDVEDEPPTPPGFPHEDDFEHFICYKCVEAFPWIKRYAGTDGFLAPVYYKPNSTNTTCGAENKQADTPGTIAPASEIPSDQDSKKRKASDDEDDIPSDAPKRQRHSQEPAPVTEIDPKPAADSCYYNSLPPAPAGKLSLFVKGDFREKLCHCRTCFPLLAPHAYLLEEEDVYEPPLSSASSAAGDDGANAARQGQGSVGSRSLLDKGEAALSNMDRVRAIEGVMVYNHLKDKVKDFLKPFAESGTAVGAEDIKRYFEGLRGDAEGIMAARGDAAAGSGSGSGSGGNGEEDGGQGDGANGGRKEQSGY